MRPLSLTSALVCSMLLAPLVATSPAGAESGSDWRTDACLEAAEPEAPIAGTGTVVASAVTRLADLPGVKLTSERLDFSGVTCELLYVSGKVPLGAAVSGSGYTYTTYATLVVDGIDRGVSEQRELSGGSTGLYEFPDEDMAGMPQPSELFAAVTYRNVESGTVPALPGIPADWQGKPYTATYTRSDWTATFDGKALVEKEFHATRATDQAARVLATKQIARADSTYAKRAAEIKRSGMSSSWKRDELAEAAATRRSTVALARKTFRLALSGQRLVNRRFHAEYAGTLTP